MEIVVVINDNMLDEPVRKAVASAVSEVVRAKGYEVVAKYRSQIEGAIEVYLAKRLTDDKIKAMIDSEVVEQMANRIRDLESY